MTESEEILKLRSPDVIACELNVPLHRVLYVLATRRFIHPSARAGRLRLFDQQAVELIRKALDEIERQKGEFSLASLQKAIENKALREFLRDEKGDVDD